jgi:hypothetical protein
MRGVRVEEPPRISPTKSTQTSRKLFLFRAVLVNDVLLDLCLIRLIYMILLLKSCRLLRRVGFGGVDVATDLFLLSFTSFRRVSIGGAISSKSAWFSAIFALRFISKALSFGGISDISSLAFLSAGRLFCSSSLKTKRTSQLQITDC